MFPNAFIEPVTETTENEVTDTGVDFLFDYAEGRHIMTGGVPSKQSIFIGVKQYVENVLRTPADTYKVYTKGETESFGISIYKYIGQRSLPMGYLNSELKREVTENLLRHPLITSVDNWQGEREKRDLKISFSVTLTDGGIINFREIIGSEGVI